jgi:ribonuclease R
MVGDATGESWRLGDRVTVKLVEAAPVAGALRFEILSEGRIETRRGTRGRERPRRETTARKGPKHRTAAHGRKKR